jgi:transketolase
VLSNGHGSMLLYALLHLTGYDLPIERAEELPPAAQQDRRATPKCGITPGVETTTGPLGQGITNAVGMALAEKLLAARVQPRRPRHRRPPHLRLPGRRLPDGRHQPRGLLAWPAPGSSNKLIALYDDNGISHRRRRSRPGSSTTRRSASRPTAGT